MRTLYKRQILTSDGEYTRKNRTVYGFTGHGGLINLDGHVWEVKANGSWAEAILHSDMGLGTVKPNGKVAMEEHATTY